MPEKDGKNPSDDTLNLTFKSDAELSQFGGIPVFGPNGQKILSSYFEPKEIEQLQALEPLVLDWIRKDSRNAVAYLANPFTCLEQTGLVQPSALLDKLRSLSALLNSLPQPAKAFGNAKIRVT